MIASALCCVAACWALMPRASCALQEKRKQAKEQRDKEDKQAHAAEQAPRALSRFYK